MANTRATRRQQETRRQHQDERQPREGPSFSGRLMALHGGAAAVTVALTALVL
jgi:hypothetical protein